MRDDPEDLPEPPRIRLLRRLVTGLTAVMILAVVTVIVLLVIRLGPAPEAPLPETVALPPGETARAVTLGTDWVAVVTADETGRERIRLFDRTTGAERQVIEIEN